MLTLEQRMVSIWDTDVVYEESFTMLRDKNGVAEAAFLYAPKQIISVTNAAGTQVYEQNRDWEFCDGKLRLTPDSRIFAFEPDELYPKTENKGHSFATPDGYILFEEGHFFHDRQIAVTYTCEKGGWTGIKPEFAKDKLPHSTSQLKSGKPLRVVLYGDSISAGANASGRTDAPPHQPAYGELLCQALTQKTGSKIEFFNPSVGGKSSTWAKENVDTLVNCHGADLVIIAFGMNDGKKTPDEFIGNIRCVIEKILENKKDTEIILIATSTPNPLLTDERAKFWGNQYLFRDELYKLADEFSFVAVADVTSMQAFLHQKKRFIDTTGNHVNHPNDFFHRCYAQFLFEMLTER